MSGVGVISILCTKQNWRYDFKAEVYDFWVEGSIARLINRFLCFSSFIGDQATIFFLVPLTWMFISVEPPAEIEGVENRIVRK